MFIECEKNIDDSLNNLFYKLLERFNIKVIVDYKIIYEEAFKHLLEDTNKLYKKNYRSYTGGRSRTYEERQLYKGSIFRREVLSHVTLIDSLRYNSIEFKKKVRKLKLKNLNK